MAELIIDRGAIELKSLIAQKIHELYEQTCKNLMDYFDVLHPKDLIHNEDECKIIFIQKLKDMGSTSHISVHKNGWDDYKVFFTNPDYPVYISLEFELISYFDNTNREICRFSYQDYDMAVAMLEKFSELMQKVEKIEKDISEKYEIPYKTSEIAKTSLQALCSKYYSKEDLRIINHELTSEIYMRNKTGEIFYLKLIHKAFFKDTKTIIELVRHPEEKKGEWFICFYLLTAANSMPFQAFDLDWLIGEKLKKIEMKNN